MHTYRTTFTPTPKIARAIQERARMEGKSISAVVNDLLQLAIDGVYPERKLSKIYKVEPFSSGMREGLDPTKVREILNEIEVEEG